MNYKFEDGEVLLIDKPYDWSSFDVVRKIRNTIKIKKIGHAGTLDPLATGLLILCTGKKTKEINVYQDWEKEYTGKLVLGKTTPSCDLETEVDNETDISNLTKEEVLAKTAIFSGTIQQAPPCFSAIKVNGKRAYKHARKGEMIEMKEREVVVKEFEIKSIDWPVVEFRVVCSKGTYIRSLARDFGQALGVGAYLQELRRTRIGEFNVSDAHILDVLIQSLKETNEGIQKS
ncbi:MAG: tRNA pseudouridine(55) synthase TruB [Cytophagaceae bacterium]